MRLTDLPFEIPTAADIDAVYKEIGVDAEKIENSLRLIKEWLKCESYLPNNLDETLLRNFIIGSKGNLERAKDKLEKYLMAKTNLTTMYHDRVIKNEDFSEYPHHRSFYICPKQMPNGNRLLILRLPRKDPTNFDYGKVLKYFFITWDILLLYDTSAGYHFIYDVGSFSPQYVAKFNLRLLKQSFELIYNVFPFRIRSLFVLNDNPTVQVVMNIGKAFMSKKLKDRISSGTVEDLPKHISKDYLPKEYGGTQIDFADLCDYILEVLKQNDEWCKESEQIKLAGPVPEHKNKLYSFEDFCLDGSFRTLSVD